MANIFLDFLNRDSRQIYGTFTALSPDQHLRVLVEALNLACFVCSDHCIAPPGFMLEDSIAQTALISRGEFLMERLIQFSMREKDFGTLLERKHREYLPVRDQYEGLFDPKGEKAIGRYGIAIVHRSFRAAQAITEAWQAGPDTNEMWRRPIDELPTAEMEVVRRVPRRLMEEGLAVTWAAIAPRLPGPLGRNEALLRPLVQHHYFSPYQAEYELRLLSHLPFARSHFGVAPYDVRFDYRALSRSLDVLGLWRVVRLGSAYAISALRNGPGFFAWHEGFFSFEGGYASPSAIVSWVASTRRTVPGLEALVARAKSIWSNRKFRRRGYDPTSDELAILEEILVLSGSALQRRGRAAAVERRPSGAEWVAAAAGFEGIGSSFPFLGELLDYRTFAIANLSKKFGGNTTGKEDELRTNLLTYLGRGYAEVPTGKGRMDIWIPPPVHAVVEVKVWAGRQEYEDGLEELARYIRTDRPRRAFMVVFGDRGQMRGIVRTPNQPIAEVRTLESLRVPVIDVLFESDAPSKVARKERQRARRELDQLAAGGQTQAQ